MFSKFSRIKDHLFSSNFHTLSIDIFDTLLLRTLSPEADRFRAIAKITANFLKLNGLHISSEEIYYTRVLCNKIVYKTAPIINGEREGRLTNILSLQLKALNIPSYFIDDFITIEIEYEKSVLTPNKKAISLCNLFLDYKKRLILVSDMYLDKKSIEIIIKSYDLNIIFDSIYISSELGITKSGGSLFDHIASQERLPPSKYLHIGDNYHSDYISPRKKGWSATWFPRPIYWRAAKKLLFKNTF